MFRGRYQNEPNESGETRISAKPKLFFSNKGKRLFAHHTNMLIPTFRAQTNTTANFARLLIKLTTTHFLFDTGTFD